MNEMVEITWVSPKTVNGNGVPMRFALGGGSQVYDKELDCIVDVLPAKFYTEDPKLFDKVVVGAKFMKREA